MFAERFGSYSIVLTTASTFVFVTFEVNQTVETFVSTTLVTNSDTTVVVTTSLALQATSNDFSGVLVVISAKSKEVILRRPFVVGL